MGCGETLEHHDEGQIRCRHMRCPRPGAVTELLLDDETEHIVSFTKDGFTVKHPLRERLDDGLLTCDLHAYLCERQGGFLMKRSSLRLARASGIYRAVQASQANGGDWSFHKADKP